MKYYDHKVDGSRVLCRYLPQFKTILLRLSLVEIDKIQDFLYFYEKTWSRFVEGEDSMVEMRIVLIFSAAALSSLGGTPFLRGREKENKFLFVNRD